MGRSRRRSSTVRRGRRAVPRPDGGPRRSGPGAARGAKLAPGARPEPRPIDRLSYQPVGAPPQRRTGVAARGRGALRHAPLARGALRHLPALSGYFAPPGAAAVAGPLSAAALPAAARAALRAGSSGLSLTAPA